MSQSINARRKLNPLQKLPLLIWLVLVWGALWQDFSAGNLLFGALIALAVSQVFYLPPIELSGRFNVLQAVPSAVLGGCQGAQNPQRSHCRPAS